VIATTRLVHAKIRLALHQLERRPGFPLLLLHGLGERSPESTPHDVARWPGSVFALDFTGHGASTVPRGGGYTAELLMADADAALAQLGSATLLGRGLGGYVAALLAGARPESVRGAILCDGPGMRGGGSEPVGPKRIVGVDPSPVAADPFAPDPFALQELERDFRPPDYVLTFAAHARAHHVDADPISVCATARPEWLVALLGAPGVVRSTLEQALSRYGSPAPR